MKQFLLLLLSTSCFLSSIATTITGTITDENGAPLQFASISVKGTTKGAIANSQGKYSISIGEGGYTLVCQHIGYKTEEKIIRVTAENVLADFKLSLQDLKMEEVVIKRGEDPALEIMRQAIKKRDFYNKQTDSFTVDVYIKGLIRSRAIPNRVLGQKVDKSDFEKQGIDSAGKGILFLSESITKVAYKHPDKIKLEVISSRTSGGGFGLNFPFFVNFYTNNVTLFSGNVNPRGFISPVADAAFHYYKFKFEGSFFEGGKMIDRIRVTPRRKNEPLFDGYIQIVDEEWRIHSLALTTVKSQGLDLLDTIRVTQIHTEVEKDVYKTGNQVMYFTARFFGFDVTGDFLNVYTNYNLNPGFKKKFFDRIVMKFDTAFNKRDSSYWSSLRPVPLEPDEKRDFQFKDSVRKLETDSMFSRRNIDSLRRSQKPVRPEQFIADGVSRNIYSSKTFSTYRFEPLLTGLEYNTVEGLSLSVRQSLSINPRKGKANYSLGWDTRYGFSNSHLNSFGTFTIKPKGDYYRDRYLQFSGGKRLQQFNRDAPIDAFTNTFSTLLYKKNYMKLYEAWFGRLEYNNRFESGFQLRLTANYEDRIPVENSTDYSFFKKGNSLLPNHPYELAAVPFNRHAAMVGSVTLSFQPGQQYIQYPRSKVPIGSNYPTLELQYAKGIPTIFNSTADFDKWKFSVYDDANLKLLGTFKYKISIGGFFNDRQVDIPDFTHFNGNQTVFNLKYVNSFQLAPYYRYSNTEKLYALLHAEHHFNGLLTNKIPLLNKLKWNLVAGTNTFYVNSKSYYVEAFAGLENILKIFRVDFVTATQAQPGNNFGVRIGLGGVIGSAVRIGR
ncbi:MAG: carboxypeptidase-like regulatory protein [Flavisolibacter sp.]|nr:carboxypeptidase-like regulatory protein [Flavisolibacter sp.]